LQKSHQHAQAVLRVWRAACGTRQLLQRDEK
jgi:hypothetical protein